MASTPWVLNVNARVKIWQGYDVTAALSPLGAGLPPDYDGPCQVLTPLTGGVTPFIAAPISPVFLGRLVLLNGTLNNASGLLPGYPGPGPTDTVIQFVDESGTGNQQWFIVRDCSPHFYFNEAANQFTIDVVFLAYQVLEQLSW